MQSCNIDVFAIDTKCSDVEYKSIAGPSVSIQKPPAFLFGTLPGALSRTLFGQYHVGPVGVYRVVGGCVSAHGTAYYQGTGLASPFWNVSDKMIEQAVTESRIDNWTTPTRFIEGDVVSLTGPGRTVWGHWLVDFLPRLYVLHLARYDIHSLRYLLPDQAPKFASQLLELVGIPASSLVRYDEMTELVSCSNLILPGYLRWGNRFAPSFKAAVAFLMQMIARNHPIPASPVAAERVFVSRNLAMEQRKLENRREIEELAVSRGFTVIDPAAYSIVEQIAIFKSARQIIGEYGSGLHNGMFSGEDVSVCAIRGSSHHPAFIQSGIADALQQDIGYVFGETPLDAREQAYTISLEDMKCALGCMDIQMRTRR